MVLARIVRPRSKRAMVARLEREGALALNLDMVYPSMDALTDATVDAICALSRERAQTLLPDPVTVVFHDTTTPCFGSGRESGLRARGYSRDGRPHRVQVVPALLITPEGLPTGHEPFPGNIHEGHTPVTAPETLERRHPELRFTPVADAGMPGRASRQAPRDRGTPCIPGTRLKASPKAPGAEIPDRPEHGAWGRTERAGSVASLRDMRPGGWGPSGGHPCAAAGPQGRARPRPPDREAARETGEGRHAGLSRHGGRRPLPGFP